MVTPLRDKALGGLAVTKEREGAPTEADRKWGKKVMERGFCIVPSLLLRTQNRLGLNPTQLAIVLHLCDHWWHEGKSPYPGKKRMAERLGIGPRQVQRHIAELEAAGLVVRISRHRPDGSRQTNSYDLSGLVAKLKEIEPDFRKVEENVRKSRQAVGKPGYRLDQPR